MHYPLTLEEYVQQPVPKVSRSEQRPFTRRALHWQHRPDAQTLAGAVREFWGIEKELHWGPAVSFREDDCRVRETRVHDNLAVLRNVAVTRLEIR